MGTLLYHSAEGTSSAVSPFDESILRVARSGAVRIVSPYIGISYLQRIISLSPEWRLISDVQEWLAALSPQARPRAWQFIRDNIEAIHHCPALHAKAVISDSLAMMGSANLTRQGILGRTEMGILLDDPKLVAEMAEWFDALWAETSPLMVNEASAYIQWLDEEASQAHAQRQRFVLSSSSRKVRARLVKLDSKAVKQEEGTPLDLGQVAHTIIALDQKHYDSVEAALEAALNKLTVAGKFTFSQLALNTRRGFSATNLREIYILTIQHCANHVRSVFVESTQNRLILADGYFQQSTKETLWPALAPFDTFLVALIGKLNFDCPASLPTEEQIERETEICGRDQDILVSELLDCGFIILDDRPGELPCYMLDRLFDEWNGRFKLFPRAHAVWVVKSKEVAKPQIDVVDHDRDGLIPAGHRVLHGDQFSERDDEDDDELESAALDRLIHKWADRAALRQREFKQALKQDVPAPKHAPVMAAVVPQKPDLSERTQVDAFFAKLLSIVANGPAFRARDWHEMVETVSQATALPDETAKLALDPMAKHPKVFFVVDNGDHCALQVNQRLSWDMLLSYPKTREVCDRLVGG